MPPGISTSENTRSWPVRSAFSASAAERALLVSKPSARIMVSTASATAGSSSTTSTRRGRSIAGAAAGASLPRCTTGRSVVAARGSHSPMVVPVLPVRSTAAAPPLWRAKP